MGVLVNFRVICKTLHVYGEVYYGSEISARPLQGIVCFKALLASYNDSVAKEEPCHYCWRLRICSTVWKLWALLLQSGKGLSMPYTLRHSLTCRMYDSVSPL